MFESQGADVPAEEIARVSVDRAQTIGRRGLALDPGAVPT
jgi:hypothetical protein